MSGLEFKYPLFLLLLIPWLAAAVFYLKNKIFLRGTAVAVSSEALTRRSSSFRTYTYRYLAVLRFVSILLFIIAAASPGRGITVSSVRTEGIDIMIALDVSGSMRAEDFQPDNRLAVAKKVISDFIARRENDRIGMVIFAGEAFLQCPLTIERDMAADIAAEVDFDSVSSDGTAIGDAIALSAARLADSRSKSRIILLITDGMNNSGSIDPETAAGAAAGLGIKIYTVGIGKEGQVPYPVNGAGKIFGKRYLTNHFDETVLKKISSMTGANFYRAQSGGVLWEKINEIDRLEKSEVEVKKFYQFTGNSDRLLAAAAILLLIEIAARSLVYRKLP